MTNNNNAAEPKVKFSVSSQVVMPVPNQENDLVDTIPAGLYQIAEMPFGGPIYLKPTELFSLPPKLYGDTASNSNRIMNTHLNRRTSTGILLVGEKGSGKSLLAKHLSLDAISRGWPVIQVTSAWHGDKFVAFLENIKQDCVLLFDEFEKIYDAETQQHMLSLFDGLTTTKKMFILTCNDKHKIDTNMVNRPGRIYYNIEFGGLSPEFIEEYCKDKLNDPSQVIIDELVGISYLFQAFSFDMLQACVEEKNRYPDETFDLMLNKLNVRPDIYDNYTRYNYRIVEEDSGIDVNFLDVRKARYVDGNPLKHRSIYIYGSYVVMKPELFEKTFKTPAGKKKIEKSEIYMELYLEKRDLVRFDKATGEFVYSKNGFTVYFKREDQKQFSTRMDF